MRLTLQCFTCGLTRDAEVQAPPSLAVDVVAAAAGVNWHGVFDMPNHRALVFCTCRCRRDALTTRGTYRLRSPAVAGRP